MHRSNPVKIQEAPPGAPRSPPVFLIHDAGGTVFSYFALGPLRRQVYGIHDPRFQQTGGGGWGSIVEMAEAYIRLIRKVVMRGTIVLGGWSFGGLLAVQIAHILAVNGRGLKVERIVLVDSIYSAEARKLAGASDNSNAPSLPGVSDEVKDKVLTSLMRATRLSDEWTPPVWGHAATGSRGSKMTPIPPPVVLIKARERVPMENPDDLCMLDFTRTRYDLGWDDMHEGFVTLALEAPGNHYSLFDDTHLDSTTAFIADALTVEPNGLHVIKERNLLGARVPLRGQGLAAAA